MELLKLVQQHQDSFTVIPNGKIKCTLTQHELMPTLEQFQQYLNSKSFKNAQQNNYDFKQHEPYLVQHKNKETYLYCLVTHRELQKKKQFILNHVNGKKYKRELEVYKQKQLEKAEQKTNEKENCDIEEQSNEGTFLIDEESHDEVQLFEDEDLNENKTVQKKQIKKQNKGILKNKNQNQVNKNKSNEQSNTQNEWKNKKSQEENKKFNKAVNLNRQKQ